MPSIAVIVTDNESAWIFRRHLLEEAVQRGYRTYLLAPTGPYDAYFRKAGVVHLAINVRRTMSPLRDMRFFWQILCACIRYRFDVVHTLSIKPNLWGTLAASLAHVPVIVGSITGLGALFSGRASGTIRFLRPSILRLYRLSLRRLDRIWFQNRDDLDCFQKIGLIKPGQAVLIRGSGVDVGYFHPGAVSSLEVNSLRETLRIAPGQKVVTMVSRTLWSKGTQDFLDMVRASQERQSPVLFLLVGDGEPRNPDSVPRDHIRSYEGAGFQWLGWRRDIRGILALTTVAMLLSQEREGVPKSLLEAAAMGKPILATDVPGCREVVQPGWNGLLISPHHPAAALTALEGLLADSAKLATFARNSRALAESDFDVHVVNDRIISDLYGFRHRPGVAIPASRVVEAAQYSNR